MVAYKQSENYPTAWSKLSQQVREEASFSEISHARRAFLWYEAYCNLSGNNSWSQEPDTPDHTLNTELNFVRLNEFICGIYSAYENEQLTSILEFLHLEIYQAFRLDGTESDPDWRSCESTVGRPWPSNNPISSSPSLINTRGNLDRTAFKALLRDYAPSKGLAFSIRLKRAPNNEARQTLLDVPFPLCMVQARQYTSWVTILRRQYDQTHCPRFCNDGKDILRPTRFLPRDQE